MITKLLKTLVPVATVLVSLPALAAGDGHGPEIPHQSWSFAGIRGHFDRAQLQRGFQVYKEVCSTCHGVRQLSFRNLSEAGGPEFKEEGVKTLAATYKINDVPNDQGKIVKRAARLSDRIPNPFDNDQQARSANNGALPPDLSLIARARGVEVDRPFYAVPFAMVKDILTGQTQEAGADYLYALLTGYKAMPKSMKNADGTPMKMSDGMHFNEVYPGYQIGMPSPLQDGIVKYGDEVKDKDGKVTKPATPSTVENYARDVTAFLSWAADPKLEERKRIGLNVLLYLLITSLLLYAAKKYVWSDAH